MTFQLQLTVASLTLYQLTDINTIILNGNGSPFLVHERDPFPEYMLELQQRHFQYLMAETKHSPEECCMFTDELGLSYLGKILLFEEQDTKIIIVGPFLNQVPDMSRVDHKFKIDTQKQIELETFYRTLKLLSSSRIQSMANLLDQVSTIRQTSLRVLNSEYNATVKAHQADIELMLQQPDDSYIELIELRYKIEKEMTRAVEKGDKANLQRILKQVKNLFDFSERFPNQPVRALKNVLIVLNTLLRGAAERGKVQPLFLHRISEKFSKQIERSDTIDSLIKLMGVMHEEYCDLVRNRAISGYSPSIQKAVEHIVSHFNQSLDVNHIADLCGLHPAHLSRRFKKETGMTLTEFQQKQRMEEAKILLKSERASIGWISGYVGYEDSGYFTRVFKKLEGMSPSQYRDPK
ncbi:AraC family transcriptional regulator [Paenibacillus sp. UNC451MF]|uniref:AraC family transcriptional regulator n=1 Tax=Paenibacillus sp. UNC451MF TaxID=1449063 RepID=UPI0005637A06|nr:AraC family transcriptional regulator [Paenibacillus sp. UNC451MF]